MDDVKPTQEIIEMVEESRKSGGRTPRVRGRKLTDKEKAEIKKALNGEYGKLPS